MGGGGDVAMPLVMFTVGTPILAVMMIFAMHFAVQAFKARMAMLSGGPYQAVAEQSASAQSETAATLAAMKAQLAHIEASLASVETVLKQVG